MSFVLDKATIMGRLGGDEEIFAALAESYLQDVDAYCVQLRAALEAGDALQLQREAHTVKGLLATLADQEGSAQALNIENQARQGSCRELEGQVDAVVARMRALAAALNSALQG